MKKGSADLYVSYIHQNPSDALYHYKLQASAYTKTASTLYIHAQVEHLTVMLHNMLKWQSLSLDYRC